MIALWWALFFAQADDKTVWPVAGRAVDARTGAPQARVHVSLSPLDRGPGQAQTLITAQDGRFRFLVPPGKYSLRAARVSGGTQVYGARSRSDGYGIGLIVDGKSRNDDLQFRLFAPAAIQGEVVDEAGEKVVGVRVQLLRSIVSNGLRQLTHQTSAYTDDRGQYRFGNLAGGAYFLVVSGMPWHNQLFYRYEERSAAVTYATTYFPNTTDPTSSAPLRVNDGEEFQANFILREREAQDLLIDWIGGIKDGQVGMATSGKGDTPRDQFAETVTGPRKMLPSLPPGLYDLAFTGENQAGQKVGATTQVRIGTGGQQTIVVTVQPLPMIAGRVRCEGKTPSPQWPLSVTVSMSDGAWSSRRLAADGSFAMPAPRFGRGRIQLGGSAECSLDRLVVDGDERPDRAIEIAPGKNLSLTLEGSGGPAQLQRFVRRGETAVAGMYVYLAPVNESADPARYPGYKSDSDGSFQFTAVKPGDYWLYAVDRDELEFRNRSAIAPYLKKAERVSFGRAEKLTRDVQLTVE